MRVCPFRVEIDKKKGYEFLIPLQRKKGISYPWNNYTLKNILQGVGRRVNVNFEVGFGMKSNSKYEARLKK